MRSREEFEEAWANSMADDNGTPGNKPLRSNHEPDRYRGDAVNFAWRWWQASRVGNDVYLSLVDELVGQLSDAKAWVKWEEQLDTIQAALYRAKQIMGQKK